MVITFRWKTGPSGVAINSSSRSSTYLRTLVFR